MKNIVVCCDGTWNTPEETDHGLPSPTNVVKIRNALVQDDAQAVYYHPGVGTGRRWWDKIAGGGTGEGLDQNIKSAYRWLGTHYSLGDRIFLFGFSRGAYTARSLCGLITKQGLLDLSADMDPTEVWKRVDEVFDAYRKCVAFANPDGYPFHNAAAGQAAKQMTPIFFIGVWDTVGALGIPGDLVISLIDNPEKYLFHDTALSHMVVNARHAVALDEHRATFAPTLWSKSDPQTDLKQVWFPGVHCDVGGGYLETGLSDRALQWMMTEAKDCGLRFHAGVEAQLRPDPRGVLHDSVTGPFKTLTTRPRPAPAIPSGRAILDASTVERNANPSLLQGPYWTTTELAPDVSKTVNIYAEKRWNFTGIYLEANKTYELNATGQWVDGEEPYSPAGQAITGMHIRDALHVALTELGEAQTALNKITHRNVHFLATPRDVDQPWFALMGFVASANGEDETKLATGETFLIGERAIFKPKLGGYLYCYANDGWYAYANNRGSVALTVTRTA
jgi:hypothetical protein